MANSNLARAEERENTKSMTMNNRKENPEGVRIFFEGIICKSQEDADRMKQRQQEAVDRILSGQSAGSSVLAGGKSAMRKEVMVFYEGIVCKSQEEAEGMKKLQQEAVDRILNAQSAGRST